MSEEWTDQQIRDAAEEDDLIEKFSRWADGVGSGWKLSIYREEPKEFSGFLEEVVLDQSENPCDLNAIVQKWGGRCLRLMLRGPDGIFKKRLLIPLRTYPPLMHGRPVSGSSNPFENWTETNNTKPEEREDKILAAAKLLKELTPPVPPQPTAPNMFEGIQLMMPLFQSLLEAQLSRSNNSPQTSINETLKAMASMKEFLGDSTIPNEGDIGSMLPSVLKIGEALLLKKNEPKPETVSSPVEIPPVKIERKNQNPVKTIENPKAMVQNMIAELPSTLAQMPGEKGAAFFLEVLRLMPEREQESCLRVLFKHFGVEDEDEDDRTEEAENPGRSPSSNAGDPTPNRPID
jgi:hypothetical protein